jgi:hypothetical protein
MAENVWLSGGKKKKKKKKKKKSRGGAHHVPLSMIFGRSPQ